MSVLRRAWLPKMIRYVASINLATKCREKARNLSADQQRRNGCPA
jgi:hypothetical protein